MALTSTEHAQVLRETKQARNAHARLRRQAARRLSRKEAEAWCETMGAQVVRWAHHGEWRWTVRLGDGLPLSGSSLEEAVGKLRHWMRDA